MKKNNSFHEKKSETVDNLQFNLCVTCTVSNAYLRIVQRLIALQLSTFICTGLLYPDVLKDIKVQEKCHCHCFQLWLNVIECST